MTIGRGLWYICTGVGAGTCHVGIAADEHIGFAHIIDFANRLAEADVAVSLNSAFLNDNERTGECAAA